MHHFSKSFTTNNEGVGIIGDVHVFFFFLILLEPAFPVNRMSREGGSTPWLNQLRVKVLDWQLLADPSPHKAY